MCGNCLVAQSGGPTAVINSSAYGVIKEFLLRQSFCKVYMGINGIEGIIDRHLLDVDKLTNIEIEGMKFLPSAGLGSCRYKLKDFNECTEEYEKLFKVFKEFNIKYFFYIGGNDSMDAASKLSSYASQNNYEVRIIGVPKTIDNDLVETDHCPGFGSAAKYVINTGFEHWMDTNTYSSSSIMVMEVMGRDAGWIAASSGMLKKVIPDINQLIYIPEIPFTRNKLLEDVNKALSNNNKLLVVTSEGLKDKCGDYVQADSNFYEGDQFGHRQLGGIGKYIQALIKDNFRKKVKFNELGISQRCAMHCVSRTDLEEAEMVGRRAVDYALLGNSGYMISLKRTSNEKYDCTTELIELNKVCNKVRHVPEEWMDVVNSNINEKMIEYVSPLIVGEMNNFGENGILKYVDLRKDFECI